MNNVFGALLGKKRNLRPSGTMESFLIDLRSVRRTPADWYSRSVFLQKKKVLFDFSNFKLRNTSISMLQAQRLIKEYNQSGKMIDSKNFLTFCYSSRILQIQKSVIYVIDIITLILLSAGGIKAKCKFVHL